MVGCQHDRNMCNRRWAIGGLIGGAFTAGAGTGAGVALGSHYAAIGCTAIRYL